jgi:hypothetical protein
VTAKLPERIKRALDAYNDVVIAWHLNVSVDEVDNRYEQLVAAIAEHVAPVDAPTEAEIEAWRSKMERGFFRYGLTIQNYTAEAVALMRRAGGSDPGPVGPGAAAGAGGRCRQLRGHRDGRVARVRLGA